MGGGSRAAAAVRRAPRLGWSDEPPLHPASICTSKAIHSATGRRGRQAGRSGSEGSRAGGAAQVSVGRCSCSGALEILPAALPARLGGSARWRCRPLDLAALLGPCCQPAGIWQRSECRCPLCSPPSPSRRRSRPAAAHCLCCRVMQACSAFGARQSGSPDGRRWR